MNSYDLSRNWFDWCFENPEKISPAHTAIYFFAIEHCNRLGWKDKFGFPTQMVMDAVGIKKNHTYIRYFQDLCDWGFFNLVQKSINQYSANIISLRVQPKKTEKSLDKANISHAKKRQGTGQGTGRIDKQETNIPLHNEPINNIISRKLKFSSSLKEFENIYPEILLTEFYEYWTEPNPSGTKFRQELEKTWDLERRLKTWAKNDRNFKPQQNGLQQNFKPNTPSAIQTGRKTFD